MVIDSQRSAGERIGGAGLAETQIGALLASLEQRDHVSAEERTALERLGWRFKDYARGSEIIRDRSRPFESCLLVEGYGARVGYLRSGRRQLTAIHVAGDFIDLHGLLLRVMDHSVIALTDCRVGFADHSELQKLASEQPHLWRLLSLLLTIDSAIQRSWLVSLGRRNPTSHLAHLICEIYLRREIVGQASDYEFEFRIGQADLADVLGLSVVHTNRTLQDLRSQNLLTWRNGVIRILDWPALTNLAEFDPIYLSLIREPRSPSGRRFETACKMAASCLWTTYRTSDTGTRIRGGFAADAQAYSLRKPAKAPSDRNDTCRYSSATTMLIRRFARSRRRCSAKAFSAK